MNIRQSLMIAAVSATVGLMALPNSTFGAEKAAAPAAGGTSHVGSSGGTSASAAPAVPAATGGQFTPDPHTPTPANGTAAQATPNGNSDAVAAERASRDGKRGSVRSQLANPYSMYSGVQPIINVPYYGAVPYNGFDWGDNYNYGLADAVQAGYANANNGNGGNIIPASPSAATSNPAADTARSEMVTIQSRFLREYENTPEYKKALDDVRKAADEFNAVVKQATSATQKDPEVKTATAEKNQAQAEVNAQQKAVHQIGPTTSPTTVPTAPFPQALTAAAQKKLDAQTQLRHEQEVKLAANPQVQQAHQKLDAAVDNLQKLRNQYETQVIADKDWQAAKQRLDTAMASSQK